MSSAPIERPITRTELREELRETLQHYVTKADLSDLRTDLAKLESSLTWRMVMMMFGAAAAGSAIVATIERFLS